MDKHAPTPATKRPARHERKDDADAFIRHVDDQPMHTEDTLAESFGEEFVRSATTGEDTDDELFLDSEVSEEIGGPFVVSTGSQEYALDDNGLPGEDEDVESSDARDKEDEEEDKT